MNDTTLTQFVQLFTLTDATATQRITERLALALGNPAAYQEQFAEELEERGIVATLPAQELRDVALVDALLSEDLLWEYDLQDTAADMAEGLNELLAQQKRTTSVKVARAAGRSVGGPEQLDALQEALEPLGLALVLLTLDSDAYPLSLVAEEQAEAARQLAKELGFELAVY